MEKSSEKVPLQAEPIQPKYASQPAVVYVAQPSGVRQPSDYLVMSIITTFFCFWPLGLIAIIKSVESRNAFQQGDLDGARRAGESSLRFNKWAIGVGIAIAVITTIFVLLCQLAWIIPLAISPID